MPEMDLCLPVQYEERLTTAVVKQLTRQGQRTSSTHWLLFLRTAIAISILYRQCSSRQFIKALTHVLTDR